MVTRYVESDLANYLLEIYKRSKKGLVILVDSNNVSYTEISRLQNELFKISQFSFEIVYVKRNNDEEGSTRQADRQLMRLDVDQCLALRDNLLKFVEKDSKCAVNLKACVERIRENPRNDESIPFVLSMYAFDEEFHGIESYIRHSMQNLHANEKDIILVLALADLANYKVSQHYFRSVYGSKVVRQMEKGQYRVSPLIKLVKDGSGKKIFFQIKYTLFTKYVFRNMCDNDKISFTRLSDRIIEMIGNTRSTEYEEIDEEIINLMNRLFIEREGNQSENIINVKGVYSALITKLIEEDRHNRQIQFDNSNNVVVSIFRKLAETYPDYPHFQGHLARYYFYTLKNYKRGFEEIDEAIDRALEKEQYSMGSLYHIKAMGYSARIQKSYSAKIKQIIDHSRKSNCFSNDDLNSIKDYVRLINEELADATQLFNLARRENNSRFISNMAESELLLEIQRCYTRIKAWCADYDKESIISDKVQLRLYDYLDNLIEDSEVLLTGGKGELNRHNEQLLNRVKEDKLLTRADDVTIDKVCRQLIKEGNSDVVYEARRQLARRAYESVIDNPDSQTEQEKLREIVDMMEENFEAMPSNNANFRIWFKALRRMEVVDPVSELENVFQKLERWTMLENASPEAFYYKYIVRFILAFEEGNLNTSSKVQNDLNDLLTDLKNVSNDILRKTIPFEWLSCYGKGLRRLVSSKDLNMMNKNDAVNTLQMFVGELPSKDRFGGRNAFIKFGKQSVYFNPQSINDRITDIHENQYVDFGIGFSYDGLRAYHDSIEIHHGNVEKEVVIRPQVGDQVLIRVLEYDKEYIKTEILYSNGEKCDIRYKDLKKLGITEIREGDELNVILFRNITLGNGCRVWQIDIKETIDLYREKSFNQPFKELLKDFKRKD